MAKHSATNRPASRILAISFGRLIGILIYVNLGGAFLNSVYGSSWTAVQQVERCRLLRLELLFKKNSRFNAFNTYFTVISRSSKEHSGNRRALKIHDNKLPPDDESGERESWIFIHSELSKNILGTVACHLWW
jgi:hypothetical protein